MKFRSEIDVDVFARLFRFFFSIKIQPDFDVHFASKCCFSTTEFWPDTYVENMRHNYQHVSDPNSNSFWRQILIENKSSFDRLNFDVHLWSVFVSDFDQKSMWKSCETDLRLTIDLPILFQHWNFVEIGSKIFDRFFTSIFKVPQSFWPDFPSISTSKSEG